MSSNWTLKRKVSNFCLKISQAIFRQLIQCFLIPLRERVLLNNTIIIAITCSTHREPGCSGQGTYSGLWTLPWLWTRNTKYIFSFHLTITLSLPRLFILPLSLSSNFQLLLPYSVYDLFLHMTCFLPHCVSTSTQRNFCRLTCPTAFAFLSVTQKNYTHLILMSASPFGHQISSLLHSQGHYPHGIYLHLPHHQYFFPFYQTVPIRKQTFYPAPFFKKRDYMIIAFLLLAYLTLHNVLWFQPC